MYHPWCPYIIWQQSILLPPYINYIDTYFFLFSLAVILFPKFRLQTMISCFSPIYKHL